MACYSMLSLFIIDQDNEIASDIIEFETLFEYYFNETLAFNRIEHLLLMNEDMLLVHIIDEKYSLSNPFDFKNYRKILNQFYRKDELRKNLSKAYTKV